MLVSLARIYGGPSLAKTKRLIEIDDNLLSSAREASSSETITGTIDQALRELVAAAARRRDLARMTGGFYSAETDSRPE
jgi:Arc/MetJ family transcription regulator